MNDTQLRETLWGIVAKKKTKGGFHETAAIVEEIQSIVKAERKQGLWDAIEVAQLFYGHPANQRGIAEGIVAQIQRTYHIGPTLQSDSTCSTTHENPKSDKLTSCPTDSD